VVRDDQTLIEVMERYASRQVQDKKAAGLPLRDMWHDADAAINRLRPYEPARYFFKAVRKEISRALHPFSSTVSSVNILLQLPWRQSCLTQPLQFPEALLMTWLPGA
jgi:hypothetical protein